MVDKDGLIGNRIDPIEAVFDRVHSSFHAVQVSSKQSLRVYNDFGEPYCQSALQLFYFRRLETKHVGSKNEAYEAPRE